MSDQFLGEIRLVGFNFAPVGWAFCQGQLLPINQNTALFSLLGVQYGGDGRTTFALPNLQGNVAVDQGQGPGLSDYSVGQVGGSPTATVATNQLPAHAHGFDAFTGRGRSTHPNPVEGDAVTVSGAVDVYAPGSGGTNTQMQSTIGQTGGGQAHDNIMPSLALNYIIALQGIFPPRS